MSLITEGLGGNLILEGLGTVEWIYTGSGYITLSGWAMYLRGLDYIASEEGGIRVQCQADTSFTSASVPVSVSKPSVAPRYGVGGYRLRLPSDIKKRIKKLTKIDIEHTSYIGIGFTGEAETIFIPAIVEQVIPKTDKVIELPLTVEVPVTIEISEDKEELLVALIVELSREKDLIRRNNIIAMLMELSEEEEDWSEVA